MKLIPSVRHRRGRRHVPRMALVAGLLAVVLPVSLALAGGPAAAAGSARAGSTSSCPWLNQSLPISKRVSLLLAQMTLADKINEVTGAGFSEPYVFYISAIPSLCIPAIGEEDGPVGVGDGLTGVTQLPSAVSLAATFDAALAYQYGKVVGAEEHGKGAMVNLGPTVNIDRDPRWGRSFEAYTEDPFLNASTTVAEIDGVQSQGEMSQVKHFAVYNQETNRNTPADNAIVSTQALHEIYLPAFWAATQLVKATSVMCAFSYINGQAACENQYLLRTTLDQRWAFPGFVTSDYQAMHSTVASAEAGTDQEMPASQYYGPALKAAIQAGQVSMATLNEMVSRILTEMFRFNEFNNPPAGSTSTTQNPCGCYSAVNLSLDGMQLLANPGTPPVSTYSVGVKLVAGQKYTLQLSGGGESANLVAVTARVTNTGRVAGSDVAQLYLDDPAVAGQPPRQLQGYQKVTLQPGQSTTVRFKLNGHELSYWNDSANGWVVPVGQFGVDVGDSSALANLPLRGSFTVTRSIG